MTWIRRHWIGLSLAGLALAGLGLVWGFLPKPPLLEDVAFSRAIVDRHGQLLRVTLSRDEKYRLFTPLGEVAPELVNATLFHEDRQFQRHPGVNPFSVARAAWHWLSGPAQGGASTVSMQLARLRHGLRTRTPAGKLRQMWYALQYERHYSKAQILEAYLNLAPYGGNVEGIGAASLLYFGKTPADLSLPECVTLASIPQSPSRRGPKVGRENPALTTAHARLWERWRAVRPELDPLGGEYAAVASPRVFRAPHFTTVVARETRRASGRVSTTLDLALQQTLENRIAAFVEAREALGIHNAAALLVDVETKEVLAHVGSADFFDRAIHGQVDGTRRARSPGSALKPFIYALALDQGIIHPQTLLSDAPRRFGDYDPENFDRDFSGPIRATEALVRSRNVPAISLSAELARPGFAGFLTRADIALPRGAAGYGLTLALGGAEVTMEDLVRLYAMLGSGGEFGSLRRLAESPTLTGKTALSRESAFLTLEMLRQNRAAGYGANEGTRVAWKTGTSNGFRDAWAIGVFGHYVLAVWVGNFDGTRNPAFVGGENAAPLLLGSIEALRGAGLPIHSQPVPPGLNVRRVELCSVSGQLPTAACRHCAPGWFIPGVSPITSCTIHREVLLDAASGLRVAVDDGTRTLRREVFEFWPHDLLALFRQAGVPRRAAPPFLPGVERTADLTAAPDTRAPQILSPRGDLLYLQQIADVSRSDRAITLRAQTAVDARRVYWFADRAFLGSSASLESLPWRPTPGTYRILALDDLGRASTCSVTLEASR